MKVMEKIYVGAKIVAAEPIKEMDFAFTKGQAWDESKPNRDGYRVRHADDPCIDWIPQDMFEASHREMTLKEGMMVSMGQFVIPDSSGSTITPS